MQGHRDLLGGQEVAAHGHRQRQVQHQNRRRANLRLGALHLEVLLAQPHGQPSAVASDSIANSASDVKVEGIAEGVGLGVRVAFVANAGAVQRVASELVGAQLREQIPQRALPDSADGSGSELETPAAALRQALVLEHLHQLCHGVEALCRVVAQESAHSVEVGF